MQETPVGKGTEIMKISRIMIAAPKSGSGKTMITCALLQALKNRGEETVSYKCGPDYIDPMFHEKIIGICSKNLDTFFTGEEKTRELFLRDRKEGDFAVLEGVMGLYDGLGGIHREGSSYHLAQITRTPVILVVDAKGMGRSLIPLIAGFLAYDRDGLIKGIILNKMSKAYYEKIAPLAEKELGIPVLGYFPVQRGMNIESRHLGLKLPGEIQDLRNQVQAAAEQFSDTVSMEKLLEIAGKADDIRSGGTGGVRRKETGRIQGKEDPFQVVETEDKAPVIAVARDEAFCFYYEDNLRLLEDCGARLEYFSPLRDKKLPEGCSGILLGGGYPELFARELSENREMLHAVREAIAEGMPSVAECGGFLYLHSRLVDREGESHTMAGIIPADCFDTGRSVRFGYIEVEERQCSFLPEGEKIRGHEFHYFDSQSNGSDCLATKPGTGKSYACIMEGEDHWWGFPHLYYPSSPAFAGKFVEKVKAWRDLNITDPSVI